MNNHKRKEGNFIMKKAIKCLTTLVTLAVLAGGLYYFWKNKIKADDDSDDFDDFDDFDDLDDFDEEETEKKEPEENTDEERGYVTLKLQEDEEEEEKEDEYQTED
jgi:hypothetical protein